MKYKFIAPLFGLKLNKQVNAGLRFGNVFMSNSTYFLEQTIFREPLLTTMGKHSKYELYDDRNSDCSEKNAGTAEVNTHVFIKGELNEISSFDEFIPHSAAINFFILRAIQIFLNDLWLIKDNSVYIRDGFFVLYHDDNHKDKNDIRSFKFSLPEVYSNSSSIRSTVEFDTREMEELYKKNEEDYYFSNEHINSQIHSPLVQLDENVPEKNPFHKKTKLDRIDKAKIFISNARNTSYSDMKIFFYISALEALLNTSKTEVTHQVAERCAFLIGKNKFERIEIYHKVKKMYNLRSLVVHGAEYKISDPSVLVDYSNTLDSILRKLISEEENSTFMMSNNELQNYFTDILFK